MRSEVEVDEIDVKILKYLIRDARANLKDIAKECGVSANAIFKRIKHLEKSGVVRGYSLFISPDVMGEFKSFSTIWLNIDLTHETEAVEFLRKQDGLFNIFRCVGRYDIIAYCATKSIQKLEEILQILKKQEWFREIVVNLWSDTQLLTLENVELKPTRER
jgi:Lrp/AsnC family leucine-responsive transcriptional regulator